MLQLNFSTHNRSTKCVHFVNFRKLKLKLNLNQKKKVNQPVKSKYTSNEGQFLLNSKMF